VLYAVCFDHLNADRYFLALLQISFHANHHNPEHFSDPETFDPSRFDPGRQR